MSPAPRELLQHCLQAALAAVDGRRVVAEALAGEPQPGELPVLAVGKAAGAMLAGAAEVLGGRLGAALCITRDDALRPGEPGHDRTRLLFGDHPVPGARSLAAGEALLGFLAALPPGVPLLGLWSGGSSALAEVPPPGIELADLVRVNRWLLASGLPIGTMNRLRARLSCLKGGRLAQRLAGRRVRVLAISDVPGDAPADIGSGPWTPTPTGGSPAELPPWLGALLARAPPGPRDDGPTAAVDYQVIANGWRALVAAGTAARGGGVPVALYEAPLEGPVEHAAERLLATLRQAPGGMHGWYGETTVRLPPGPGAGGRNSHLALSLGRALRGRDDVTVLCVASDGSDGTGGAAGGWADGGVLARGEARGLDAERALARADSGSFLAVTGDALVTGPTGTNVMDLVLALKN